MALAGEIGVNQHQQDSCVEELSDEHVPGHSLHLVSLSLALRFFDNVHHQFSDDGIDDDDQEVGHEREGHGIADVCDVLFAYWVVHRLAVKAREIVCLIKGHSSLVFLVAEALQHSNSRHSSFDCLLLLHLNLLVRILKLLAPSLSINLMNSLAVLGRVLHDQGEGLVLDEVNNGARDDQQHQDFEQGDEDKLEELPVFDLAVLPDDVCGLTGDLVNGWLVEDAVEARLCLHLTLLNVGV